MIQFILKMVNSVSFQNKKPVANTVHIAGRGKVVHQLRILVSQFRVLRTGTLFEIRPDNMYQPLWVILNRQTHTI